MTGTSDMQLTGIKEKADFRGQTCSMSEPLLAVPGASLSAWKVAPVWGQILLTGVLLCAAGAACAAGGGQDKLRGRELYENQCTACHESVVHIRERRSVRSLGELYERVEHWRTTTDVAWSKEEVKAVVEYLNARYYKF